jgi:hypothetical protein
MLPKGAIKDLTLDSEDNLWFSIGGRIFCYMTGPRIIKEINSAVFGKHTILSASRAIVNHREQIVFGSTDHLIVIDPRLALNQPDETQILLTDLQIDHQKTKIDSLIRLSYQSKWVTLFFTETGTDFYNNKYQYRIRGVMDEWQSLDIT